MGTTQQSTLTIHAPYPSRRRELSAATDVATPDTAPSPGPANAAAAAPPTAAEAQPDLSQKRLEKDWLEYRKQHGNSGGVYDDRANEARMKYIEQRELWLVE